MDKAILYIHGKGGNPKEAEYYNAFFKEYDVIGFNYFYNHLGRRKKSFLNCLINYAEHISQ